MPFNQSEFDVRCEWGEHGVAQLAPINDVIVIVDVLLFTTNVEIATKRDAIVFPYPRKGKSAVEFSISMAAILADPTHSTTKYSLSPQSLIQISKGTRLVLPSPNGSTLTLKTGSTPTLAGCLRNSRAVARAARKLGRRIAVVPAGERWKSDGGLRPAFEDWVGAGAIISQMNGSLSPEARAAVAAFQVAQPDLTKLLKHCSSGKELIQMGLERDVEIASELDVSDCIPLFKGEAYVNWQVGPQNEDEQQNV